MINGFYLGVGIFNFSVANWVLFIMKDNDSQLGSIGWATLSLINFAAGVYEFTIAFT